MALEIRPVQPEDREAILAFTRDTWQYGDYIALVWDTWMADAQGAFLTATWYGEPVSIVKVSWTEPDEVWLEGLRVHPGYRGRGVATALFQGALQWSVSHGARMARLATGEDNLAVHRMVEAAGLRRVYTSHYYLADSLVEGEEPQQLSPAMGGDIWTALQQWGGLERSHGLYGSNWAWPPLTPERLMRHLLAGQVYGVSSAQGLEAVAIVEEISDGEDGLLVGLLDGVGQSQARLSLALRARARRCHPPRVEISPRDESELLAHLHAAGYRRGTGPSFWVYEGSLEDRRR